MLEFCKNYFGKLVNVASLSSLLQVTLIELLRLMKSRTESKYKNNHSNASGY